MRPFVTGADPHLEGFAQLNCGDPVLGQHASMKERVARPIREFNEAKSFFGVEPFHDPANRWTRKGHNGCSVEPGSGAECTGLRREGIGVEVATPRITEGLVSHWLPNLRVALGQFGERGRSALLCGWSNLGLVNGALKLTGERRCSS